MCHHGICIAMYTFRNSGGFLKVCKTTQENWFFFWDALDGGVGSFIRGLYSSVWKLLMLVKAGVQTALPGRVNNFSLTCSVHLPCTWHALPTHHCVYLPGGHPVRGFASSHMGRGTYALCMYMLMHALACARTQTQAHTHTRTHKHSPSLSLSLSHTLTFLHTHRYSYRDAHTHTRPNTTVMILVQS